MKRWKSRTKTSARLAGVLAGLCFGSQAYGASASIVAERGCAVRLEGDEFEAGQRAVVVRDVGGRETRLAVIRITRVQPKGRSVAQVIQGQKQCGKLKGATVKLLGPDGKVVESKRSGGGSAAAPKLDVTVLLGGLRFASQNIHSEAMLDPEAQVEPLNMLGLGLDADVYPLSFMGDGFVHRAIGLGVKYRRGILPEIPIEPQEGTPEGEAASAGKLALAPQDIQAELIVRVPYLKDSMATELRVGYLMHSLFSAATAGPSVFWKTNQSGLTFGFMQRWSPSAPIRVNAGASYALLNGDFEWEQGNQTGLTDSVELKAKGSALGFSLAGDFIVASRWKASAGMNLTSYKSVLTPEFSIGTGNQSVEVKPFELNENYMFFHVGLGFLL